MERSLNQIISEIHANRQREKNEFVNGIMPLLKALYDEKNKMDTYQNQKKDAEEQERKKRNLEAENYNYRMGTYQVRDAYYKRDEIGTPKMEDGKPVLDKDGKPVMENVGDFLKDEKGNRVLDTSMLPEWFNPDSIGKPFFKKDEEGNYHPDLEMFPQGQAGFEHMMKMYLKDQFPDKTDEEIQAEQDKKFNDFKREYDYRRQHPLTTNSGRSNSSSKNDNDNTSTVFNPHMGPIVNGKQTTTNINNYHKAWAGKVKDVNGQPINDGNTAQKGYAYIKENGYWIETPMDYNPVNAWKHVYGDSFPDPNTFESLSKINAMLKDDSLKKKIIDWETFINMCQNNTIKDSALYKNYASWFENKISQWEVN